MGSTRITFLKGLYYGRKASAVKKNIRKALRRGALLPGLYLITFASNGIDQLDIIEAKYLDNPWIGDDLPPVAGLAVGRAEAFETVRRMAEDSYRETGSCDLQAYLKSRKKETDVLTEADKNTDDTAG
ncbi:MAG: hypothetical protein SOI56_02980 [Eubacteriales bacterium]|jgi:hypothetical protein